MVRRTFSSNVPVNKTMQPHPTAQTVHQPNVVTMTKLNTSGQTAMPVAPTTLNHRTATAQVSTTVPIRGASSDTHESTVIPRTPIYASGIGAPIVLRGFGSMRGTGKSIVIPPPQPFVPALANRVKQ